MRSLLPAEADVEAVDNDDWFSERVRSGALPPVVVENEVQNHSWVPTVVTSWVPVIRRIDYIAARQPVVAGLNNQPPCPVYLGYAWNAIIVGCTNGRHAPAYVTSDSDGSFLAPKPDLVASQVFTSHATPDVASDVYELSKQGWSPIQIKAALIASAQKPGGWRQEENSPYDKIWGAGIARGDRANEVVFSGSVEHSGGPFSAALVWNRHIFPNPEFGNLGWHRPEWSFEPMTLELSGVAKASSPWNVQHIYINDLPAGVYELKVNGNEEDYALAWISG